MDYRKVGLTTCAALVLANIIGTGVFTSLGFQVASLPSPFVLMLLWVIGGIVALCGAMCYSELAAALPRSGGEYNFLSRIYHPCLGFMAGFVSVVVGFSAPAALTAIAFGKYLSSIVPAVQPRDAAIVVVVFVTVAHAFSMRMSSRFQVGATTLKVGLIVLFIAAGLGFGAVRPVSFAPSAHDAKLIFSGSFAVALMYVLYAYSGWNAAAYITSEVRDPQRVIPRALLLATAVVTVLYVMLNATFLLSGPMQGFAGHVEVGEIAARGLFGEKGRLIMGGLICLGLISALSALTLAGPRVSATVGEDFDALQFLAKRNRAGVPTVALLVQTAIVIFLLLTSSFETVLLYAQFALIVCCFLAVLGLIVLRIRKPDLPRPFRCWAYPLPPVIFLLVSFFTICYTAFERPVEALAGLATLALGIGLYFVAGHRKA